MRHLLHKHKKQVISSSIAALVTTLFVVPSFGSRATWVSETYGLEATSTSSMVGKRVVTHMTTPDAVRGLYVTAYVAGSKELREKRIVSVLDSTEANAVIIDIKDYTGRVFVPVVSPNVVAEEPYSPLIPDIEAFIDELHAKGVYVIGRIAVFQDQHLVSRRPDLAVLKEGTNQPWRDYKKIAWLDPGSREVWQYAAAIGQDAYDLGFDEINYDYIRFPADGDMKSTSYRFYDETSMTKAAQIREFYQYLHNEFARRQIPISGDLYGMTTTNTDDLGIGQVLEYALENFDYVAPMVYPSHYPSGFYGYKNPAAVPYEIISFAMGKGVERAVIASTSPLKLRPWLQDFNLGAPYTADKIKAQKKAVYDVGLTSWMMWDPSNTYTVGGLEPKRVSP